MAYELDQELLTLLQSVDTPTVCNAIEVAQGKRGFSEFTRGTILLEIFQDQLIFITRRLNPCLNQCQI